MPIYKIISYFGEMLDIFHHSYYKMFNIIISVLLSISILLSFNKDNKDNEDTLCKKIEKIIDNIINVIFPFINSSLKTEEISNEETETGDITSSDFKKYYQYIVN